MSNRPDYSLPIPSRASKSAIWQFAEEQRQRVGLKNGFQLADVVRKNRGTIEYIDFLDDDQTDAIIVEPDGSFKIRLSSYTGALRDNFTIAHELGHRLLHWPKVKKANPGKGMRATRWVDKDNKDLVRCEWEANWFAAALLMPKKEFSEFYKSDRSTVGQFFGVTEAAAKIRAESLGL
ncbi:MAG: ImmA/IrrE family metallo-endopeptidase [Paracoccus sp. (in: a-proteobacteria)]|uniref:ImmA/IrrE family metallo-endopeptidase n=1 Tax=Paracoccus sp. TaxID=267 RepID=UPI0026DF770B|nr:ImmA/IrrE family metallo-endopeptidase [Paracoccus sp. (in: a-proteobacteria)]MDO5632478.1 ImmA/IrrE family metallo-endopeptidase [Paracoccus sp. (in: a-proteobacteria)]